MKVNTGAGVELYKLTASEALGYAINRVAERYEISKSEAKVYVLNSLVYNVVINEIESHVGFLRGDYDEETGYDR